MKRGDPALQYLLDLNGETMVIHPDGYWVKFSVTKVLVSRERPHGLDYSLTLHGPDGERLIGFDNAHPVRPKKRGDPRDHLHADRKSKAYEYRDAAELGDTP